MEFKILGTPEASAPGRPKIQIAQHLWGVLVSLLMAPGVPVAVDILIDHLWGATPPKKARVTIRSYVSRINLALKLAAEDVSGIQRFAGGYVLNIDRDAVDLHRFRSLRRQAEALIDSGDCEHASLLLRQADALWRGPALATLDGDWIASMRNTIQEERRAATLRRTGIDLIIGRHTELVGELGQLCEEFPLDEALARLRMTALYRSGRQADALEVFRDMRARLIDSGIQPGAELVELHQFILRHDRRLSVSLAQQQTGPGIRPNTLPPAIHDFVGRAAELLVLTGPTQNGETVRICVVEGMAGVGKTALAVRAAHQLGERYPDAQLYLSFHEDSRPGAQSGSADAISRLLRMLEIPPERIPVPAQERARLWQAELRRRRLLIILDDVTDPEQVRSVTPAESDCLIIACSRRRRGDWPPSELLALYPLTSDEAFTLMIRLIGPEARRVPDLVTEAVRLCGRLPLAIRVAAGRLRNRSLSGLGELLDELLDFSNGERDAGETGRLILSAFEFSYCQLSAVQQRFFRYLGISPCSDITLESAIALTGTTVGEAASSLIALMEHQLLERASGDRFRFHDIIRAYAATRCLQDDPLPERRHAAGLLIGHYLATVEQANQTLFIRRAEQGRLQSIQADGIEAARTWLDAEWYNIVLIARYAGNHEWKRECADLASALGQFLQTSGYWNDAQAMHSMALSACRDLQDLSRTARAAFDLSLVNFLMGHRKAAEEHALSAMAIYRSLNDRRGQAAGLDRLGTIYRNSARLRDALAHHREAMDIYREIGDIRGEAESLVHAGSAFGALCRYSEEISCLNKALGLYRQAGDKRGEAIALNNLGAVYDDQGSRRNAMVNYQKSLAIFKEISGRQNIAILEQNMGRVLQYEGSHEAAIAAYRSALGTHRATGDLRQQAVVLDLIGSAFALMKSYSESLAHHERAAALAADIGDLSLYATALCGIGDAHCGARSYSAALECYGKARKLATEIESPYLKAKALHGTAETLLRTRDHDAARIHWREALDIYSQLGLLAEAALVELRLREISAPAS